MNALTSLNDLISALQPVADRIQQISIGLMAVFFTAALVEDHFHSVQGESSRAGILFKAVLFFACLSVYETFFVKVEAVGSGISAEIFSETDFSTFVRDIWTGMSEAQGRLDGVWGVLKGGVSTIVITLSYMVAILAYKILQIGKLLTMGILFTLGPLALAASVFPGGGRLTVGLARNVIAVACWPIVGNLMLRLLKEIGIAGYYSNPEQFIPLIAANITFAFSLMMVPSICSSLIAGGSVGTSGSVIGLSTLTTALSPLSYSWMRLRDMAWEKGTRGPGRIYEKIKKKVSGDEGAARPGDRVVP